MSDSDDSVRRVCRDEESEETCTSAKKQKTGIEDPGEGTSSGSVKRVGYTKYFRYNREKQNALCLVCEQKKIAKTLQMKGGNTNSLKKHLLAVHKPQYQELFGQTDQTIPKNQQTLTLFTKGKKAFIGDGGLGDPATEQAQMERKIVQWLATKNLPFSFFDDEATQNLFKKLNPNFVYPKRDNMRRRVLQEYDRMKSNLKELLLDINRVSFTVDGWTSISTMSYYGITIHFIDSQWKLQSLTLDFLASHGKHSGEDIANLFYKTMEIYDLKKKIQGITLDNAASNTTFILKLEEILQKEEIIFNSENQHFRCFAHIINLGVQDALKLLNIEVCENPLDLDDSIDSASSEDEENLALVDSDLNSVVKIRKLFKIFKQSEQLLIKLKNCCDTTNIKYIKPHMDVKTRWNSTYDMLKTAIGLKPALNILCQNVQKIQKYQISENEWMILEEVTAFLKHFKQISVLLCGEKYPTLPLVVLSFNMLLDKIDGYIIKLKNQNQKTSLEKTFLEAIIVSKKKLMKHYTKTNWIYCATLILDPRHKYDTFSLTPWGREMKDHSINIFETIFKEKYYTNRIDSPVSSTSSSNNENDEIDCTSLFVKPSKGDGWKKEINEYLEQPRVSKDIDVLEWWKKYESHFPTLAKMAKDFLSIQATSVASERMFSRAGLINSKLRSMLNEMSNKCLLCISSWCRCDIRDKLLK